MADLSPSANPPITAAGLATVVNGLLAAFSDLTSEQTVAIGAAVYLVAAWIAQRFTRRA